MSKSCWELSEREKEEDSLSLATVQETWCADDPVQEILFTAMDHFKFAYGGFNGWFRDREDLVRRLRAIIDHEITMAAANARIAKAEGRAELPEPTKGGA